MSSRPRQTASRHARLCLTLSAVGIAALFTSGCATAGYPVTGKTANAPDAAFGQSETAVTTAFYANQHFVVVAYNDETNSAATIQYTATTRKVLTGASLMGWSYSTDQGKTWTYGGKVSPPAGWAVLWGDPALTTAQSAYRYVFMSNLAIPTSKMPVGGIDGPVNPNGADAYIGGACIARSSDGGKTFSSYQCVSNTDKNTVPNSEKGHFYDGGSMASSSAGEVYAGYVDVTTSQIDVWRSPSVSGVFTRLPNPFSALDITSHARMRVSYYDNALYVAARASNGAVYINRYLNGQWGNAIQATNSMSGYPCVAFETGACAATNKLKLRTGPQFDFDIGAASDAEGTDAIRFIYTRTDPQTGRFYVTGAYCPLSLSACYQAPEWGTTPGNLSTQGDQFNPNLAAWRGFIGLPPVWRAAYLDRDGAQPSTVKVKQGTFAYLPNGTRIHFPFTLYNDMPICPDLRGYWGDYDDVFHIGFSDTQVPLFIRTMSDSSLGCPTRWQYWSNHLHIRALVFP